MEQVEVVPDQLHLVQRLVERHRATRCGPSRGPRAGRPSLDASSASSGDSRRAHGDVGPGDARVRAASTVRRRWLPTRRSAALRSRPSSRAYATSRAAYLSSAAASARITGPTTAAGELDPVRALGQPGVASPWRPPRRRAEIFGSSRSTLASLSVHVIAEPLRDLRMTTLDDDVHELPPSLSESTTANGPRPG